MCKTHYRIIASKKETKNSESKIKETKEETSARSQSRTLGTAEQRNCKSKLQRQSMSQKMWHCRSASKKVRESEDIVSRKIKFCVL